MVTGYLKPDSGRIMFDGRDIVGLSPRQITQTRHLALVPDPAAVPDAQRARQPADRREHCRGATIRRPRPKPCSTRFELRAYAAQPAGLLPEGIRKLLDVAMALSSRSRLLLLDEPTSGVSADEKFAIMDVVMGAARAAGVTVIFVEHDMDIVARFAGRVVAFYDGGIIGDGPPDAVLRMADVRRYVIGEEIRMLRLDGVSVSIGPVTILRGVNLDVAAGEFAGLIGRNGAGKTTLLRTIMGLLRPASGTLDFVGRELAALPTHRRAGLGIGYMPEDRRLVPAPLGGGKHPAAGLGRRRGRCAGAARAHLSDHPRARPRCARARRCSFPAASRSWSRSAAR